MACFAMSMDRGGARLIASGTLNSYHTVSGITTSSLKSTLDNYKTGYTFVLFYINRIANDDARCYSGRMKINDFINWYNTYYSVANKYYTANTDSAYVRINSSSSNSIDVSAAVGDGATVEFYVTN